MAYVPDNLSQVRGNIGGRGRARWEYWNVDDSLATILGSGYVSDATKKGLRVGDVVEVYYGSVNTTGPDASPATAAGGTVSEFAAQPTAVEQMYVASISSGAATLASSKFVIGGSAAATVGFYGTTPAAQPNATAQSAVPTTTLTTITDIVTTASVTGAFNSVVARVEALVVLTNKMRADLVTIGLIKGSN